METPSAGSTHATCRSFFAIPTAQTHLWHFTGFMNRDLPKCGGILIHNWPANLFHLLYKLNKQRNKQTTNQPNKQTKEQTNKRTQARGELFNQGTYRPYCQWQRRDPPWWLLSTGWTPWTRHVETVDWSFWKICSSKKWEHFFPRGENSKNNMFFNHNLLVVSWWIIFRWLFSFWRGIVGRSDFSREIQNLGPKQRLSLLPSGPLIRLEGFSVQAKCMEISLWFHVFFRERKTWTRILMLIFFFFESTFFGSFALCQSKINLKEKKRQKSACLEPELPHSKHRLSWYWTPIGKKCFFSSCQFSKNCQGGGAAW